MYAARSSRELTEDFVIKNGHKGRAANSSANDADFVAANSLASCKHSQDITVI